jgi:AmmeMemoRadiSam system protein A
MNQPQSIPATEIASTLLRLARASIAARLGRAHEAADAAPWLKAQGATFVTLNLDQKLRGCIGSLRAHRALGDDVKANAQAAAFNDPRFKPLTAEEYARVTVEVSLLSGLTPMQFTDQASMLAQLKPGEHGVIFEYGHHRCTYLPQVWEQIPQAEMFMATLKQKAGLPPTFWELGVKIHTYTVAKFKEA